MSDDLRATLTEAMTESTGTSDAPAAEGLSSPTETASSTTLADGLKSSAVADSSSSPAIGAPPKSTDGRDEKGRFAPKKASAPPADSQSEPPADSQSAAPETAAPTAPAVRAPPSLSPAEREHWAKAPPEIQRAFVRRENELRTKLNEHAALRKMGDEVQRTVAPYEAFLRSHGSNPVKALESALATAYTLRTADPQTKARAVADLIKAHAIPVEALAAALDGTPAPTSAPQAYQDPRVDQIYQMLQAQQQTQQQALQSQADRKIQAFAADPKNEFFEDVKVSMGKAIDAGLASDLETAYDLACNAHPEIRKIVQQRRMHESATASSSSAAQAAAAGSSVKPNPAGRNGAPDASDLRSTLEHVYNSSLRR